MSLSRSWSENQPFTSASLPSPPMLPPPMLMPPMPMPLMPRPPMPMPLKPPPRIPLEQGHRSCFFLDDPKMSQDIDHREIVIAFVAELEKARQYFNFKDFLRNECPTVQHSSDTDDVTYELNWMKERTPGNLLDESDICHAVHRHINELWQIHKGRTNPVQPVDTFSVGNPFCYHILQAREEGYTMDEDIEIELRKIKQWIPIEYQVILARRKPDVDMEARSVIVSNIPEGASEKEVRCLFRMYGSIKLLTTQRTTEGLITAHITFKDLNEANRALTYKTQVRYWPGLHPCPLKEQQHIRNAPLVVKPFQPKSGQDENVVMYPGKVKDVSQRYLDALATYSDIRSECSKYRSPGWEPFKKEDYWIDWMGYEANFKSHAADWKKIFHPSITICELKT